MGRARTSDPVWRCSAKLRACADASARRGGPSAASLRENAGDDLNDSGLRHGSRTFLVNANDHLKVVGAVLPRGTGPVSPEFGHRAKRCEEAGSL